MTTVKSLDKAKKVENNNASEVWFIIFGAGDGRNDYYGWSCRWKEEMSRTEAKKAGDRSGKRIGERNFNYYYCKKATYVTDSFSAFKKKCEKVGLNPSKECLAEYGY